MSGTRARRWWGLLLASALAAGTLTASATAQPRPPEPPAAPPATPAVTCTITAGGLIGQRWQDLNAGAGPLGCPTGQEQDVPGRRGRKQSFDRGEVVWSPDQGPNLVVSAYRVHNDVTVDWGPTNDPWNYDGFLIGWFHNGLSRVEDVYGGPRTWGTFTMPLTRGAGRYDFTVTGCDKLPGQSGHKCDQGAAIPVSVTLPDTGATPTGCPGAAVEGTLGRRWREMGGATGKLGCPTGAAVTAPKGRVQSFQHGQLAESPGQGGNLVVATYSVKGRVYVEWGPTDGYFYDFFIVRWYQPGREAKQADVKYRQDRRREGFYSFNAEVGGEIGVEVEGCDNSLGGAQCRQGWTQRVATTVRFPGGVDLAGVTATTPAEAPRHLDKRRELVADYQACQSVLSPTGEKAGEDTGIALMAHLERLRRKGTGSQCENQAPSQELVNRVLRQMRPYLTGSSTDDIPTCHRDADYDAVLKSLVVITSKYWDLVYPLTRKHLLHHLLSENGPHSVDDEKITVCGLVNVPETENHRLLIESSRYLSNQRLREATGEARYDNVANGMREHLLRLLQLFAKHDFMEYNARPYQRYSLNALLNLFDHAQDPAIRTAAQIVLDYATTKFAVSSNQLRRAGPFRRITDRADADNQSYYTGNSDPQTGFFLLWTGLAGNTGGRIPHHFSGEALIVGVSGYVPPRAAIHRAMDKSGAAYQHSFQHGARPKLSFSADSAMPGIEVYRSSPSFQLTAGGIWGNSGYGLDEFRGPKLYGRAQATTLMPTHNSPGRETRADDLIRFDGFHNSGGPADRDRVNTCVQDGFACGLRLSVPQFLRECAQRVTEARWEFLNLNTPACGNLGVYVALNSVDSGNPAHGTVGVLHAVESTTMDFATFHTRTRERNPNLTAEIANQSAGTMTTAEGRRYQFKLTTGDNYETLIKSIDGQPVANWTSAPLVSGPILRSRGHEGHLEISYPECQSTTTLDYRDPLNPAITTQGGTCR
ncbi:LGFP repeat-containing protein [Crossiella sp. NPDC003009]